MVEFSKDFTDFFLISRSRSSFIKHVHVEKIHLVPEKNNHLCLQGYLFNKCALSISVPRTLIRILENAKRSHNALDE